MTNQLLAGFGKVDITPKTDSQGSFEILDPIYIRAFHLQQGEKRVTFLTADLFLLDDRFVSLVANHLKEMQVDAGWLLCGASHLGTGPTLFSWYVAQPVEALRQFGNDEHYALLAAKAIGQAIDDLSEARVASTAVQAPKDLSYNRRARNTDGKLTMVSLTQYPQPPEDFTYDPTDRQLGIMSLHRKGKRPVVLVNYGCHALSLWDKRGNISGDYPGRMCQILDGKGIDAVFYQGALGNVHPVRKGQEPCDRIANILADLVQQAVDSATIEADVQIHLMDEVLNISPQQMPSVEDAKAQWDQTVEQHKTVEEGLARYRYWLAQRYEDGAAYPYRLRAVVVGSTALLHLSGEPFVETALAIRQVVPFNHVFLLANPCPEVGYLPSRGQHEEGGDEPLFAPLNFDAASQIEEAAIDLLAKGTHSVHA